MVTEADGRVAHLAVDHAAGKRLLRDFLRAMEEVDEAGVAAALDQYCTPKCRWEVFHPFNTLRGVGEDLSTGPVVSPRPTPP